MLHQLYPFGNVGALEVLSLIPLLHACRCMKRLQKGEALLDRPSNQARTLLTEYIAVVEQLNACGQGACAEPPDCVSLVCLTLFPCISISWRC